MSRVAIPPPAPRSLDRAQLDAFHRDGFVALGKILEDAEVVALRDEYDRVLEQVSRSEACRNLSQDDGGVSASAQADGQQVFQVLQMCERSLAFRRLLYDARILDRVQDLLGPNIQLFHDQALYKPPRTGGAVFWHQDNGYWGCRPANLVSCWVTLDDTVRDSGAMQFVAGSHLAPVAHTRSRQTSALHDVSQDLAIDESRVRVVELPAGGALLHHCQTLHYTQPNVTERHRHAFAMHFMVAGTATDRDGVLPVGWSRPLLRRG